MISSSPSAYARIACLLLITLLGCSAVVSITPTPISATTIPPPATGSPTASPTVTHLPPSRTPRSVTPRPTIASPAIETPAPDAPDIALTADDITIHPGPQQYAGDWITIQVRAPNIALVQGAALAVAVMLTDASGTRELARGTFGGANLAGEAEALFIRVWQPTDAGIVHLTATLDPDDSVHIGDADQSNNTATLAIPIAPANARPANEIGATWVMTRTICCEIHYITGTAVERDLAHLVAETDTAVADIQTRLNDTLDQPISFYLIPRVLGHGGFAGGEITLSYLDRNYPSGDIVMVVRHEAVHILDRALSPQRTTIMAEGLAVYVAGGHFKPEPITPRMAELVRQGGYIPLRQLADNFYPSQHEASYLEGAAFIDFLVRRADWETFTRFYRASGRAEGTDAERLDRGLREVYDLTLAEAETAWLAELEATPYDALAARDIADTMRFFDAVRAYQRAYDPSAYFLRAWLPSMPDMAANQDVAEFLRHPTTPENIALETMLVRASHLIEQGDYDAAEALLPTIEHSITTRDFSTDPVAARYLALVHATLTLDYEPQAITLTDATTAQVLAVPLNAFAAPLTTLTCTATLCTTPAPAP